MNSSILYSASSQVVAWSSDTAATPSASDSDKEVNIVLASSKPKRRTGRKKFKETRHPVYRGVRRRNLNKWVCELRDPNNKNKRIWLGTYPTAEMAARAHDVAVLAFNAHQNACVNFADSVWRLPIPLSNNAKDIREAAAKAAEAFRPKGEGQQEEEVEDDHDHVVCSDVSEEKEGEVFKRKMDSLEVEVMDSSMVDHMEVFQRKMDSLELEVMDLSMVDHMEVFQRKMASLEVEVLDSTMIDQIDFGLIYSPTSYFDFVGEHYFGSPDDLGSDVEVSLWNFSF